MVLPEYADGRDEDNPDLERDPRKASEKNSEESSINTRKGGQVARENSISRVIVDMREFRSELPALIHKRGIDVEPATIEVSYSNIHFQFQMNHFSKFYHKLTIK